MPLVDFDIRFSRRALSTHAALCPSSTGDRTPPADGVALGVPAVAARVDQGRWIADCPTEGCGGAEYVSLAGAPFFCTECRNAATGHLPVPVLLPDEKTCGQVDAYLSARPSPATRNWSPDETVKDLQRENREHGIRLP